MKVTVDLDPRDIWHIQQQAESRGITPGAVLREQLATRRNNLELRDRIRSRVLAGLCDADIAAELNQTPRRIAETRRNLGLPANPRYRKKTKA